MLLVKLINPKTTIVVFIFALFLSVNLYSQTLTDGKKEITIHFKDGKTLSGKGYIWSKGFVRMKLTGNSKFEKFYFKDFDYAVMDGIEYVELPIKGKKKPKILRRNIQGHLSLYVIASAGNSFGNTLADDDELDKELNKYISNLKVKYYMKKDGEEALTFIGSDTQLDQKDFWTQAGKYLNDCESLLHEAKKGTFLKENKGLRQMILYYNANCISN